MTVQILIKHAFHQRKFCFLLYFLFVPFFGNAQLKKDSTILVNQLVKEAIEINKTNNLSGFACTAYLKNSLLLSDKPDYFLGKNLKEFTNLANHQLLWLYESCSDIYFVPYQGFKESVLASRSFGKYPSWEFKSATDLMIDFSKDGVRLGSLSDRNFVSPIGGDAFQFYNFKFKGSANHQIHIAVEPKNTNTPTFKGDFVLDSLTKKLLAIHFNTTGNKGIEFIDSLAIDQEYALDKQRPNFSKFTFKGQIMKFTFSGIAIAEFNHNESLKMDSALFERSESQKVNAEVFNKKILDQRRSIPLTLQERLSFDFQDTLRIEQQQKDFSASINGVYSKNNWVSILFSDLNWKINPEKSLIIFQPIIPAFFYNTVEGAGLNYGFKYIQNMKNGKNWSVTPKFRYGIANRQLNSDVSLSWLYQPLKRGSVNFSFGKTNLDLNPNGTLNALQNTVSTLLFEQNFMKLFRKEYTSLSIGKELIGNLYLSLGSELSRNQSLLNSYDYKFRDIKQRNFSSNNPLDPSMQSELFPKHTSFHIDASFVYTINQPYIIKDGQKIYKLPLGPRFLFTYRRGFPNIFGSVSDYQYLELEVQQEKLDLGLWGYGSYSISGGKFFDTKNVYYPEWRHFSGNMALVFNPGLRSFHLLDFYTYSTNQYFFEAHFEHNFNKHFTSYLPLLKKLRLEELIGGAYLYQPQKDHYFESYLGLRRLMFRLDYAFSFNNKGMLDKSLKFSYNF